MSINLSVIILLYLVSDNILFSERILESRNTGREREGRGASNYSFAVNIVL